jgi:hypothetical protein
MHDTADALLLPFCKADDVLLSLAEAARIVQMQGMEY